MKLIKVSKNAFKDLSSICKGSNMNRINTTIKFFESFIENTYKSKGKQETYKGKPY